VESLFCKTAGSLGGITEAKVSNNVMPCRLLSGCQTFRRII
jgi:hypothetical protein